MSPCRRSTSYGAAFALAITFTLSFAPALARGAEGGGPAAQIDEPQLSGPARQLFLDGQAARKAKQFQACYDSAHGAWKLHQFIGVAALIGDCAFDLGKYRESAERLSWFFDHLPQNPSPALISYMRKRLARAKEHIATVRLSASVGGARLLVDGAPVEEAQVFVDPGQHTFEAQADGYQTATLSLQLAAGAEREVALELVAAPVEVPAGGGGGEDGGASLAGPIVLGIIGVAGFIAGGALFGVSAGARSDYDDKSDTIKADGGSSCVPAASAGFEARCAEVAELRGDANGFAVGGGIAIAIGGAAAAGALLWLLLQPDDEPSSSARVIPMMGGDQQGVMITGHF